MAEREMHTNQDTKRQKEGEETTDNERDSWEKKKRLKHSSIRVMTDTEV